jgi:hypothetical protein
VGYAAFKLIVRLWTYGVSQRGPDPFYDKLSITNFTSWLTLARNIHFISGLMESGADFVAVDMPHATRLTIHILAEKIGDQPSTHFVGHYPPYGPPVRRL